MLLISGAQALAQTFGLQGQLSAWATVNPEQPVEAQVGLRYIPIISSAKILSENYTIDAEISLNSCGSSLIHSSENIESDGKLKPYRMWLRLSSSQFELRAGLQKINFGSDTNTKGPEIVLDGAKSFSANAAGLWLTGEGIRIWELVIRSFAHPNIWIDGNFCNVAGCYIGTDASGTKSPPDSANGWAGILIQSGSDNQIVAVDSSLVPNVISANNDAEILISNGASRNAIIGNIIGLSADLSKRLGYFSDGIRIQQWAKNNFIFDNTISANRAGLVIWLSANNNEVGNNLIGTNHQWRDDWRNNGDGIRISSDSKNNSYIENIIGKNGYNGIRIDSSNCTGNRFSHNHISGNYQKGIKNSTGLITAPVISRVTATSVSGTAPPKATVEIYSDPDDEGQIFEGETTADASGNFDWSGTAGGPYVTAIAIDDSGNTSEFSNAYNYIDVYEPLNSNLPGCFKLFQNYPNPFNPVTEIQFSVKEPRHVELIVYNLLGREIARLVDEHHQAGLYSTKFDATRLTSGIYVYKIQIGDFQAVRKMVLLK